MFLKQSDIFNFNVDEIEIYGTFCNYEMLLEWINNSNTDYLIFDEFTLKKSDKLRDYEFKVDFWKNNFPCFAFYIWKKLNTSIETRDYFKVYWSAFQIMELNEIIDFIDSYLMLDRTDLNNGKRFNTLKRFDLAIDIKKPIDNILKNFNDLSQKWASYFGAKWEVETHYIWEYQKRYNKALLIRIYDKIKDIKKKNKQVLYWDYLLEDNITRIELEFRTELIKNFKINNLLDKSYILNLFIKYIEKHTKLFEKIKTQDIEKLKRLNKKINLEELQANQILRDRYISSFQWYAKTILKLWACPVDILIRCLLLSDITKHDIALWIEGNIFDPEKYIDSISIRETKYIFAKQEERINESN